MNGAAAPSIPPSVHDVLDRLWATGHAAYVVGGGVRDVLLGREANDWDVATDARPERITEVFVDGRYENRFGTVTVRSTAMEVEVTTFRRDHQYADHRRPDTVTFTDSLEEDLARRDFTVNAIAWGRARGAFEEQWVDPTNGRPDLDARLLRAVGEPAARFDEDGLRLLRAARLAAELDFHIETATRAAMTVTAPTVAWVSQERIGAELTRMVAADPPSAAFVILAETGVLPHAVPELAAQRGVPQDKIPGHDLWGHCLATVDGAARIEPDNQRLRLAALLHDIGKPTTFADGHFVGHDTEGARLADKLLSRMALARREAEPVVRLIENHMFNYEPRWSGAAIRRFVRRVGRDLIDDLIKLRAADNIGSGLAPGAGHLDELRARIDRELAANPPLSLRELAIDGDDLISELRMEPGPRLGETLDQLLNLVIADPAQNRREVLIGHAKAWLASSR